MPSSSNVARGLAARGPRDPEMPRQTPRTVSQESLAIGAARGHLAPPGSMPTHSAQIQRVLAIPSKRFTRTLVRFLVRPEVDALLAAPDRRTWFGKRDHAFILMAVQTGLRLSEITGAKRDDLVLESGAHVRVIGKGRKERCTPLAK